MLVPVITYSLRAASRSLPLCRFGLSPMPRMYTAYVITGCVDESTKTSLAHGFSKQSSSSRRYEGMLVMVGVQGKHGKVVAAGSRERAEAGRSVLEKHKRHLKKSGRMDSRILQMKSKLPELQVA